MDLEKSSGLVGPPFLEIKLFSWSVWVVVGRELNTESLSTSGCGYSHKSAQEAIMRGLEYQNPRGAFNPLA